MNILLLSRWFPYPANNGSKLRIYNLLRGLADHHNVTLLSFADRPDIDPQAPELLSLCREVQVVPWKRFTPNSWRARFDFLSATPRSIIDTFSPEMKQRIDQTLAADDYNVVIASQIDMAAYSRYFSHLPALFEEIEVGVLYEKFALATSPKDRFRYGLTWAKHRRYLASLLKNFQTCTVVSSQEQQLLSQAVNNYRAIEVIPNCVDVDSYRDIDEVPRPNTLIFTGSFTFGPNYEAMVWFLKHVWPRIQAHIPEVKVSITGNHANRPLPPSTNVTLTGFVDDVRPLVARAWGSIVPLHTGGGTRLKILEAMALDTPVVATSKGVEGLDAVAGQHLLIADSPEAFARRVIDLLQDPALRQRLAANARRLVNERYNWPVVMPRFLHLVETVAHS